MSNQGRLCPVCRTPVAPTRSKNIAGHLNPDKQPCPAHVLPYTATVPP